MKNFKKLIALVLVAMFALVLVACGGGETSVDETKLAEQADLLYLGKTDEVANDLKLPKYVLGDKEFAITWESSDSSVIEIKEYENEDKELYILGSVNMASEVKVITLTATVTYKELSTTRSFEITVLADEYQGYENIAAVKAKDDKTKDVSKVKFSGTVSFTTKSGFGVTDGSASIYCYQSNHGRTVGEQVEVRGVWTYYNNMVQIASGCVVKSLGTDASFNIANIAEAKTISEIFAIEAKTVDPENCTRIFKTTFAAKANAAGDYNAYKLVDPTDNSKYVDLSKYNDSETISYVGELAASGKYYEGVVIIYCSRSAGNGGLWDVLLVPNTVKEVEVKLSDAQIVAGILGDLNSAFNGKKVKENLELPTESNGATITWASSNEAVISASGVYTAPKANTEVKLTATVVLNSETQTIELTVVAASAVKTTTKLVTAPQAGVAYKLGIDQVELGQKLFATGAMSSYYGATTTEHADSIDVYLEAVEGGYYVYTTIDGAKKYICVEVSVSGDKTYINFKYLDAANVAWVYNAEYNTITCTVNEKEAFIGTKGTYNTIGGYDISTIANGYPVHFYEEVEEKAYTSAPEVGVAYKLGMDQTNLDKILYANGAMSSYYGATTEAYAEGIDVYFEATEGGYYIYSTIEGAKKYICVEVSVSGDKTYKNFKYLDAPSNVWTFNAEFSTVVTTISELELFIGTRGTYNTVSVYETKELADDFPVHFYTKDPNGGAVEPEPDPEPKPEPEVIDATVTEILAAAKDLADGSVLESKYTTTGTVTEVTAEYSEQFGNVSFKLSDGTNVILCYRVKGDEAANVKIGDTITLTGEIKNYGGTIEFVNATIISRTAGQGGTENPGTGNENQPEADLEGAIVLDFVSSFGTYAAEWTNSYVEHAVTNADLGVSQAITVNFTRADRQNAGNTIDDRPVVAAKNSTEYVTVVIETGNIKVVQFDLKQWTSKTFDSIVIEYFDGTNWVACSDVITTPAKITSSELAAGVTQVRLAVSTTATGNTQVGISNISLVIE